MANPGVSLSFGLLRRSGLRGLALVVLMAAGLQAATRHWAFCPRFNPAAAETVEGEVVRIDTVTSGSPVIPDRVAVLLKTPRETILVCLGPKPFLEQQGFHLSPGERLTVVGSRTILQETPVLVAQTLTRNGRLLHLRGKDGEPLWQKSPGEPH